MTEDETLEQSHALSQSEQEDDHLYEQLMGEILPEIEDMEYRLWLEERND